jgi:hypothetical protein
MRKIKLLELATAFLIVLQLMGCGGGVRLPDGSDKSEMYRNLDHVGIPRSEAEFKGDYKRKWKGMEVQSVVAVPDSALQAVETGYMRTVARHSAQYPQWQRAKTLPEVKILFVEPRTYNVQNEPGSPALLIKGRQSCGTVIGINHEFARDKETQYIVLPHQAKSNWAYLTYLENCSAHEGEHFIEFPNDYQIFSKWNANDPHPRPFERCGTDPSLPC